MISTDKKYFYDEVVGAAISQARDAGLAHSHAYLDINKAASGETKNHLGINHFESEHYFSCAAREIAFSLFNRVTGLGIEKEATEQQIIAIKKWMNEQANPNWVITLGSGTQPININEKLIAHGFIQQPGGMAHFWREASPLQHHSEPEINIVEVHSAQDSLLFGQLFNEAFERDPRVGPWLSALVGRKNWHCYIAYYDGVPAGLGALMISKGIAWLGIGGTIPAFRSKGIQQALIARRINDASQFGAKAMTIECGYLAGEQPYPASGRNILRSGFQLSYVSRNYAHY